MNARLRLAAPWVFALFACTSLLALEATITPLAPFDEGFVLVDALRLSRGEVPYRDYELGYGPLEAASLAPLIRAIGPELMLLRALRALAGGLVVVSVGLYLWQLGARTMAVLAMVVVASYRPAILHVALGALLVHAVAALHALQLPDGPTRRRRLALAGLLAGITGLGRYDFGVLAVAATSLALVVQRLIGEAPPEGRTRWIARDLGALLVGTIPALSCYALLAALAGPERLSALIELAVNGQAGASRRLPFRLFFPANGGLNLARGLYLIWGGLFAMLLGFGALVSSARKRDHRTIVTLVHLEVLLIGFGFYGRFRPDVPHLFPSAVVATLLLALLAASAGVLLPRPRLAVGVAGALLASLLGIRAWNALLHRAEGAPTEVPGLRGLRPPPDSLNDIVAVLRVIDELAPPGEPVYVGCEQHERIIWNDALLYALAGRPIPTRSHQFNPGWTTTEGAQRAIINDLERAEVRVVVLRRGTWTREPNASANPGARVLDDWLRARFAPYASIGESYEVLVRRD